MFTQTVKPLAAELAQPLNESIRGDNSGQFALMLSLLHEALIQPQFAPEPPNAGQLPIAVPAARSERSFNLEMQLGSALAAGPPAQVNLLRSILVERTELMLAALAEATPADAGAGQDGQPMRRSSDALLAQLDHARAGGLGQLPGGRGTTEAVARTAIL